MLSKSTTCLLLTLMLLILVVPAMAGGDPPPTPGIHPWDNNDGARIVKTPEIVHTGWMWLGGGSHGAIVVMPRRNASQQMKREGRSDKAIRSISGTPVIPKNR